MTKVEGGGGVESHREPCVGLMFVLILALLLKVFQTNISKLQFKTDCGKKKSHFLEQQTVLLFKSIYFVLYVHMRRMKGREEGCKGCAGCLSQSRALACHLSVSDTQRLEYVSIIGSGYYGSKP